MRGGSWGRFVAWAALVFALGACGPIAELSLQFGDLTPHEAYYESLKAAGLAETALGRSWVEAAEAALVEAPNVSLPHEEEGFIFAETPEARSYRFRLRKGQLLSVRVSLVGEADTRLFLDVYRLPESDRRRWPTPVVSTDSLLWSVEHVANRDAEYVLRLQPELLRGGRYRITIDSEASLTFPVENHDTDHIQSRFGVARDGGRRSHHGVDIFAPRRTRVLSATDGVVSRVEVTNLGGKVVWVRDSRLRQSIYYAHLDSQLVTNGARVRKGDPIGLVGNSGNARTTPPHLHFGLYRRGEGPTDPYYFLYEPTGQLTPLTASLAEVGDWTRTRNGDIRLRSAPSSRATVIEELQLHTAVRVVAATGSWYRVRLPDGRSGFVAARLMEDAMVPLRSEVIASAASLKAAPVPGSPTVQDLGPGSGVDVLGAFGDFLYVRPGDGRPGWMVAAATDSDLEPDR